MEIWYDPADNTVKAVYSETYTGSVWSDLGYLSRQAPGSNVGAFLPGAVIDLPEGEDPVVVTPAPPPTPPEPTARELRLAELAGKLRGRTATTNEIQEYLVSRLEL